MSLTNLQIRKAKPKEKQYKLSDGRGMAIHPQRRLRPSSVSLERLLARARRLYEQGGSKERLWEYVTHWHRWLHGGLKGLVTRKGGVRRYYIYILRRLRIP